MSDPAYHVSREIPAIGDYLRLRRIAGLTPRSEAAAAAGLPNSNGAVVVRLGEDVVGMGRLVGDRALFFQVVDIAVDPEHQGRGLGKAIMAELMEVLAEVAPAEAYISLVADGEAHRLYSQFGFEPVAPKSRGMALWLRPAQSSA